MRLILPIVLATYAYAFCSAWVVAHLMFNPLAPLETVARALH
jgi:hypothetical protein